MNVHVQKTENRVIKGRTAVKTKRKKRMKQKKIDPKEFWDFVKKVSDEFNSMSPEKKEEMRIGSFEVYRAYLK